MYFYACSTCASLDILFIYVHTYMHTYICILHHTWSFIFGLKALRGTLALILDSALCWIAFLSFSLVLSSFSFFCFSLIHWIQTEEGLIYLFWVFWASETRCVFFTDPNSEDSGTEFVERAKSGSQRRTSAETYRTGELPGAERWSQLTATGILVPVHFLNNIGICNN